MTISKGYRYMLHLHRLQQTSIVRVSPRHQQQPPILAAKARYSCPLAF